MGILGELKTQIDSFEHGDLLSAVSIQGLIEKSIIDDNTNFDQAAALSKFFDDWTLWIKSGFPDDQGMKLKEFQSKVHDLFPHFDNLIKKQNLDKLTDIPAGKNLFISDMEVFRSFLTETQEHLENVESKILNLEFHSEPKEVNDIFRSFHTIKGVASFLNLDSIKSLTHSLEYLLDDMRNGNVTVTRELIDTILESKDWLYDQVNDLSILIEELKVNKGSAELLWTEKSGQGLIERLDSYRKQNTITTPGNRPQDLFSPEMLVKFNQEKTEILEHVETIIIFFEKNPSNLEGIHEAFRLIHTLKGNAGFFGLNDLENLCMEMEFFLDRLRKGEEKAEEPAINSLLSFLDALKQKHTITQDHEKEPLEKEKLSETKTGESETLGRYALKKKDIRVDTEKLDSLFDLIGELITAQAMVIDNPELKDLELSSFNKAAVYLTKITKEIQNVTMSIRMIPLEGLFSKMNRLVRDLARKFDKPVELEISGQDTEMDRNIIEEISDPLIHIIRNAIDHGIERKEIRSKIGKNPQGRISLNAKYEGNEIWISIRDDGKGLNKEKILEKAWEKGILKTNEVPSSEQDIWKVIFEPGFSTAESVSEISGRGVGMDVVKKNIEKLRGQIAISTMEGNGTEFTLKIPLTLAIIDAVLLRCGDTLFSLPIADVAEFQNFTPENLTHTDTHHELFSLRDEILPLVRLTEVFKISNHGNSSRDVILVLRTQNKKMALLVDEIVGYKQIVLKALPEYMGTMDCISGCTILGNGDVSLIIDVHSLFRKVLI